MISISQFPIGEVKYPSQMCYVNGNIVIRGFTPKTIRVYQEETGSVLNQWSTCHMFPRLITFQMEGKEYLLEGCRDCKVICSYESPETSSSYKTLCKDIVPYVMCQGPNNTVLVLDEKNTIKQLCFSGGRFNLVHKFSNELENVITMCYCEKNGIIVMIHTDKKSLTGVTLATEEVVWKHTEIQFGSPAKILSYFTDVFTISDGSICIFNLDELFVLDSKDGTIKYKLFHYKGLGWIWSIATSNIGFQQRFAFHHGKLKQTQISLYKLLTERWLPLQNIMSDEEILQTNE